MIRAGILCISLLAAIAWTSTGIAQGPATRVTVRLDGVSLRASLDSLMQWFGVSVVYLDADIEGKQVTVDCDECDLGTALDRILSGTSLTWARTGTQVILRKRAAPRSKLVATVSGSVTDSITGQSIAGANVLLHEGAETGDVLRWCPANEFGFYSLRRIPPGTYTLVVRTLGYHPARTTVTLTDSAPLRVDIALHLEEIRMQEVTIEGHRSALSSTEGYTRGLYIPGPPSDQTQYLLEGARIYNPSHFGSVLSTFNAEVIADVDVTMGGLPPRYGGRIGGMLDLSMRNGTRHRLSGSAGTGSLGSQLALEGPLGPGTAFLLSWRRGYPDPIVPFLNRYGSPSPLGTTEIIGRLSHRFSGSQQLALSGYISRDTYTARVEDAGLELNNNFGWENRAVSVRWNGIASPSLFLSASAVYTGYDFSLEHIVSGGTTAERYPSEFSVQDLSVRARAEHYYDDHHMLRGGVELVHRRIGGDIQKFSTQIAPLTLRNTNTWELSVYVQDQWLLMPRVSAGLGARATTYTGAQGSYSAFDPRFSLLVALDDDTRLYGALTSIHQFVHGYRNSGIFFMYPPNFFYPSSEEVKPTSAVHAALGIQTASGNQEYVLSAESFYRVTYNVHGFFAPSPTDAPASLTDATRYGSGLGYGVHLSARKRLGDLRGAVRYTLAWAKETYAGVNGGKPIPSPFDRRHEVQGSLLWVPAEGWTIGLLCVLTANEARTFDPLAPSEDVTLGGVGSGLSGLVDVNGGRLPGFQRLEVEVARTFSINSMLCSISLRFLNAYGLTDPFVINLNSEPDGSFTWRARLRDLKLFPLFPALAVNVRF
ncbi:MAG: TonB-dependent receptor [Bacteroidota bacterium]